MTTIVLLIGLIGSTTTFFHQATPQLHAATQPAAARVRIATWNIRDFSTRTTLDLRTVGQIILTSGFDLLAIQEVKQQGEEVDRLLNTLGPPWRASAVSPQTGNNERFVFIYRGDHVSELGGAKFIDLPDPTIFDRTPYQDAFRAGKFDFWLITAHLSYTDTKRRKLEAEALAKYAHDLGQQKVEHDVIVLGDFNEQGKGNLHFFEEQGFKRCVTAFTSLSVRETLDNILINPSYTREYAGASGSIHFDETLFNSDAKLATVRVSDHRPAWADFSTTMPDDD